MTDVLHIPMFDRPVSTAVDAILEGGSTAARHNLCISATGAHGLVYTKKNAAFAEVLRGFYWNLPDGMPAVLIGRLKGAREMQRCYGPDLFKEVMIRSSAKPIRHFFCGGQPGVAGELKNACEKNFSNFNIVGVYSPPFRALSREEIRALAADIDRLRTDVIWLGLSTPKQEMLAKQLSEHVHVHYIITVGAAFDFHTGRLRQAPRWIRRSGFEWFFRLCMEPRRLFMRYLEIVPMFLLYNMMEGIVYLFSKGSGSHAR